VVMSRRGELFWVVPGSVQVFSGRVDPKIANNQGAFAQRRIQVTRPPANGDGANTDLVASAVLHHAAVYSGFSSSEPLHPKTFSGVHRCSILSTQGEEALCKG
jgi:hypothetical protein